MLTAHLTVERMCFPFHKLTFVFFAVFVLHRSCPGPLRPLLNLGYKTSVFVTFTLRLCVDVPNNWKFDCVRTFSKMQ